MQKGLKSYIILLTLQVFMSFQRWSIDKFAGLNPQVRKWLLILFINLLVLCVFWLFGFLCCVPMLIVFSSFKMTTKAYWSLTFNDGSTSSISSGKRSVLMPKKIPQILSQHFDHHLPPLFQIQSWEIDAQEEFPQRNERTWKHWVGNPELTEEKKHYKEMNEWMTESSNALQGWFWQRHSHEICFGAFRLYFIQL